MSELELPEAWFRAGSNPRDYEMGIDPEVSGRSAPRRSSRGRRIQGFGTLMQNCLVGDYLGKRLRFSSQVRSQDVEDWAGLWLRIDSGGGRPTLGFDNMRNRPIRGSNEWQRYSIVLDVPESAASLAYGILVAGVGQVWIADASFEVVTHETATTGGNHPPTGLGEPTNLDFES